MLNINAYLNYLYFYSSEKLTLRPGLTLWGSNAKFSSENYTYNLYTELFQLEKIYLQLLQNQSTQ